MKLEIAPLDRFRIFLFANRYIKQDEDSPSSSHTIMQKEVEPFHKYSVITRFSVRFQEESSVWSERGRGSPKVYCLHFGPKADYEDSSNILKARKQRRADQEANKHRVKGLLKQVDSDVEGI